MKFKDWLKETTTTVNIEKNLAKGHIDVIGGIKYKKKKRKTKLDKKSYAVHEAKSGYKAKLITDFGKTLKARDYKTGERKKSLDVARYLVWGNKEGQKQGEVIDTSNDLKELDKKYNKLPVYDMKGNLLRKGGEYN